MWEPINSECNEGMKLNDSHVCALVMKPAAVSISRCDADFQTQLITRIEQLTESWKLHGTSNL